MAFLLGEDGQKLIKAEKAKSFEFFFSSRITVMK